VPPADRKFVRLANALVLVCAAGSLRTTTLIERSFEQRRRTKVIPRFFAEGSCLKPAYAALESAAGR